MRVLLLLTTLALLPCAHAQLTVTVPGLATCTPGSTLTPILGIAVDDDLGGYWGITHARELKRALNDAGFKTAETYAFNLLDRASIQLEGELLNWRNAAGDEARTRVGRVYLTVTDLSSGERLFTLQQASPHAVFQAQTFTQTYAQIVTELRNRYCQLP